MSAWLILPAQEVQHLFEQKRYEDLVALTPKTKTMAGGDVFRIAQAQLQLGRDTAAARLADRAITQGYRTGDAYLLKGLALTNLRIYDEAVNAYKQCLILVPHSKKARLEKANAFYLWKQLDSALADYRNLQRYFPEQQFPYMMEGQILFEREDYPAALGAYRNALPRVEYGGPFWVEAQLNIARLQKYHLNNWEGAAGAYEELLKLDPNNSGWESMLVQLHLYYNKGAEASEVFGRLQNKALNGTLTGKPAKMGGVVINEWTDSIYFISFFRFFSPRPSGVEYLAYIFNEDGTRGLGKAEVDTAGVFTWVLPDGFRRVMPAEGGDDMVELCETLRRQLLSGALSAPADSPGTGEE